MGRLPPLAAGAVFWLALLGCESPERKGAFATRQRSQAVQTTESAGMAGKVSAIAPAVGSTPQKPRRALCGGRLQEGKSLPKKPLSRASAEGAADGSTELLLAKTGFTWINFWAAWCAPCKEEIPRLNDWARRLSAGGSKLTVVFVSLDDDERQLRAFLESSPDLRSTYWLKEGSERDEWMSAAGLSPDPELPIHLLSDAQGKTRCKVQGAVEDSDYPELVGLLGR